MKHFSIAFVLAAAAATASGTDSPYAGEQSRVIKSLSPQQVDGYLEGRGMGFAKAAELNHFPGPRHVLDLADELELRSEQKRRTRAIFEAMKSEAMDLGNQLVDRESELDRLFASGDVKPEALRSLLSEIGTIRSQLRFVHLRAHLEQRALLTRHQVRLYDHLRGYGDGQPGAHGHTH